MASKLKPLPIGIQTFEKIIEGGYTYIDKTQAIYNLVKGGTVYFLSRPRRFGKSLLISTLDALFSNQRELFKGLWVDSSDYKWQEYTVIRVDMAAIGRNSGAELNSDLKRFIFEQAKIHAISIVDGSLGAVFTSLITALYNKYQKQIVVLVDEYDKAILDNITNAQVAKECRDILREFYTILKSQDENLRFVFLAGVSKFSKISIFSGLNNLKDISMDSSFASICGYTQEELELNFKNYIDLYSEFNSGYKFNSRDELLETIKEWYNGYRFTEAEVKVYNPFSTLLLFDTKQFSGHWFATGTPKFLLDIIEEQNYTDVENFENLYVERSDLEKFDFDNFHIPSILYQTGYQTIRETRGIGFILDYPNKEVSMAFVKELLDRFTKRSSEISSGNLYKLTEAIKNYDLDLFFSVFKSYLAQIPFDIHLPYEKYYQSIIYMVCRLISDRVDAEVSSNIGEVDMVMELAEQIYIFEFKINQSASSALEQIREKKYYEKYLSSNQVIKLIGVSFSTTERNITECLVEDCLG